jgi:hypothetical protein
LAQNGFSQNHHFVTSGRAQNEFAQNVFAQNHLCPIPDLPRMDLLRKDLLRKYLLGIIIWSPKKQVQFETKVILIKYFLSKSIDPCIVVQPSLVEARVAGPW